MAKFEINRDFVAPPAYKTAIEADSYELLDGYFVFKKRSNGAKVAAVASALVHTINRVDEEDAA